MGGIFNVFLTFVTLHMRRHGVRHGVRHGTRRPDQGRGHRRGDLCVMCIGNGVCHSVRQVYVTVCATVCVTVHAAFVIAVATSAS
jgi:hypothetical protein